MLKSPHHTGVCFPMFSPSLTQNCLRVEHGCHTIERAPPSPHGEQKFCQHQIVLKAQGICTPMAASTSHLDTYEKESEKSGLYSCGHVENHSKDFSLTLVV